MDADKVPRNAQVVTARWVHTDKTAIDRALGKRVPLLAKSRLVAQGLKGIGSLHSDSPTASLLAFNFAYSLAASKKWNMRTGDAPNA